MASKARKQSADARDALRMAYAQAPAVVAFAAGGWTVYPPTETAQGATPEILVLALGRLPVALSEAGEEVWSSVLRAALR
jgi:hypothetical protein